MKSNEVSVWMKDKPECVTLSDDEDKGCVFVNVTDGFYLCREEDVDALASEMKSRIRRMNSIKDQNEWIMAYL